MSESLPHVLSTTTSLCPHCLSVIDALYVQEGDDVFLIKTCREHGQWKTLAWRGTPAFTSWRLPKKPAPKPVQAQAKDEGCPFDCGLCEDHTQRTCTALIEVTENCNLGCPVCFAQSAGTKASDPTLDAISILLDRLAVVSSGCNVQLSGGEPTTRDDLPEIVALAKTKGFAFVQLNTNGLRLATDTAYGKALVDAGLSSVFLQFDGVDDLVYTGLRGRELFDLKKQAIAAAAELGLAVVLVPTVAAGINEHQLGAIVQFALETGTVVRGVHFQPVSLFGRFPAQFSKKRITLPDIMRGLEEQTNGLVHTHDFSPPSCEHALCSFHAKYLREADGTLKHMGQTKSCCSPQVEIQPVDALDGAHKSISCTAGQWTLPKLDKTGEPLGDMDAFLADVGQRTFSLSAMAFQDAWSLDLERLRGCCIHCVAPDGRLIPFCAYNLTSAEGHPLYRQIKDR
ncbi:radical SAM (seleno)protein TrsS [Desulfovibrio inopinatus]|uniref:radical SAM (seleno)protein TrsS n=1 Tax=Desulfovibrio inopinatus TaxID=102109 RepID=UPI0004127B2F|nr:radical SAM (seleno)protein TrsS [Desulfovibrio inopinatus]